MFGSLRARVAAAAVGVVCVLVLGAGLALVEIIWIQGRTQFEYATEGMAGGMAVIAEVSLGAHPDARSSPGGSAFDDAFEVLRDYGTEDIRPGFARALDTRTGRRIVAGDVPAGFPRLRGERRAHRVEVDGRTWVVASNRTARGVVAEAGIPLAPFRESFTDLRWVVLAASIGGLLITAVLIWLVVRLALRPLTALRRKTAGVADTKDLDVRVSESGQPVEVGELAETLDGMLARLQVAAAERERALEAARRFAADAGHELRTPLQSVRTNLEILGRDDVSSTQRATAHAAASGESGRMNRLVDGLQTLARGEAGLQAAAKAVDLGDIVDGAVSSGRRRHPHAQIEVELPPEGPIVTGDSDGLWRVVDNMIENAVAHGREAGRIRVAAETAGEEARLSVDDDGPGIPPEERQRVLKRFERGRGTRARGSGLGLAIVAAEARRHDGRLRLGDSDLGGLRIELAIPAAPGTAEITLDVPAPVQT